MARLVFTRQLARFMALPQVDTDAPDLRVLTTLAPMHELCSAQAPRP